MARRKGAEGLFLFDDLPDLRRDVRPASRDRADGRHEVVEGDALEDGPARAGGQRTPDAFRLAERRENEDLARRVGGQERVRHLQAVHARHEEVEEDDVGMEAVGLAKGRGAVPEPATARSSVVAKREASPIRTMAWSSTSRIEIFFMFPPSPAARPVRRWRACRLLACGRA